MAGGINLEIELEPLVYESQRSHHFYMYTYHRNGQ